VLKTAISAESVKLTYRLPLPSATALPGRSATRNVPRKPPLMALMAVTERPETFSEKAVLLTMS